MLILIGAILNSYSCKWRIKRSASKDLPINYFFSAEVRTFELYATIYNFFGFLISAQNFFTLFILSKYVFTLSNLYVHWSKYKTKSNVYPYMYLVTIHHDSARIFDNLTKQLMRFTQKNHSSSLGVINLFKTRIGKKREKKSFQSSKAFKLGLAGLNKKQGLSWVQQSKARFGNIYA